MSQVSPLCATRFGLELQQHPNQALVSEVLQGLLQGFRLGFNPGFSLQSAKKNKASAYQHPEIVDAYLANEVALGRVAGPFHSPPLPNLHINSFGVIPKKGQPNKWHPILDMSSPLGSSVNEGINPNDYPLQYIRVDDIVKMVSKFGEGALMAKFDVEAAYRNLAVHPSDRYLIGMKWRSMFYVDLALPFRLRSAPYIFNSVADLVEWILLNNYHLPDLLHYLDDFITAGPPNSPQCESNLSTASSVCITLGLPLHPSKKVGPTTCMVTLGIELDSVNHLARLPNDKLTSFLNLLHHWSSHHWCTKRQLQSLIGHLHHAAKVVWPGRAFIRRMINLLHNFSIIPFGSVLNLRKISIGGFSTWLPGMEFAFGSTQAYLLLLIWKWPAIPLGPSGLVLYFARTGYMESGHQHFSLLQSSTKSSSLTSLRLMSGARPGSNK